MPNFFLHGIKTNIHPLFLVALILTAFGVIEINHPYFFLQDDNRVLFFPLFVDNFKAFANGEFPLYNFHQYLGLPTGIQAHALYLPNYIATGLSYLLLGHYFGTIDILALFHLVVASLGFYFLMRHFALNEICCCLGAAIWVLSAFVITVSNSWIHVSGSAAYLPWIAMFSLRLMRAFTLVDFLILMLLKVALILVSHPQFALYVMSFEFAVILLLAVVNCRRAEAREGGLYFAFGCLLNSVTAAFLSLPLLIQGRREASESVARSGHLTWNDYLEGSNDIWQWLSGLVAPLREVETTTWNDLNFISHVGYIPLILLIVSVVSIRKGINGRNVAVFIFLAVFSLFWASKTFVTDLFYYVPVFNKFRTPFKLVFFTTFFVSVIATFGADCLFKKMDRVRIAGRSIAPAVFVALLFLHVVNMVVIHIKGPQHTFIRFEDRIPIEEPLLDLLKKGGGRIVSAGLDVPMKGEKALPGFSAPLLGYNYASLWGIYHFGGYSALVPEKNNRATLGLINSSVYNLPADSPLDIPEETLEHYRKWGVAWYLVDARIPKPVSLNYFQMIHSDPTRYLFLDIAARPMVYWEDTRDDKQIQAAFSVNSVIIESRRDVESDMVLNILYNPRFSAVIDGSPVLIQETDIGQVSITVPTGQHRIKVEYTDRPLLFGVIFSSVLSLVATLFVVFRKCRTSHSVFHG